MSSMAQRSTDLRALDRQLTDNLIVRGEEMLQPIASGSFTPNSQNLTQQVLMRAVGLTRGFLLKVTATLANAGSGNATLTPFGAANLVSNVTLTDLDNYQRINTPGWHLDVLGASKEGFPFGAALLQSATDGPVAYGNNYNAISATATLASGGGTGTVQMYYWIPCAYGMNDLRGALFTQVVNSAGYVAFTINSTPGVTTGDGTLAMYKGANSNVSITNVQYTMYQAYIDQLPRWDSGPQQGRPMLPPISIRTQYRLANTNLGAVAANQDFAIPFTNFQSFLSAAIIYDNGGVLNPGTDLNYWRLTAANTLQFFSVDPTTQALRSRFKLKTDMPAGSYLFDFRSAPINTNQAGNIQLVANPSSASSSPPAQFLVGWESFADVATVLGAQSLASS